MSQALLAGKATLKNLNKSLSGGCFAQEKHSTLVDTLYKTVSIFQQIPHASLHNSIIQPRHILSGGDTAMWCNRIWSWKYYCIVECCRLISQKSL